MPVGNIESRGSELQDPFLCEAVRLAESYVFVHLQRTAQTGHNGAQISEDTIGRLSESGRLLQGAFTASDGGVMVA